MDIVEKLGKAVSIPTVSHLDRSRIDYTHYEDFLAFLPQAFPVLFSAADVERIADYSLLLRLPGNDESLKPVLLLAHYDVVPEGDEVEWKYPPFSGTVAEEKLWGRGTLDNKGPLITILQAAEEALQAGWIPAKTIYLGSGHDEEIGGSQGARNIVAYLRSRGVHLDTVFDEGMTIVTPELFPMVDRNVAFIGTSEKGQVDIEITAAGQAGHASMPPASTAAGAVARAVAAIERNPFPARLTPPVVAFLKNIAPLNPGFIRFVLSRPRLFDPVLKKFMQRSPTSNALVRTTQAVTMLQGSGKENVLPARASAVINCRILPGETIEDVIAHIGKSTTGLGVRVGRLTPELGSTPLPISSPDTVTYRALEEAILAAFPDIAVVPTVVTVTTDSRHFAEISDNIYRFIPMVLDRARMNSIHSVNERIPIENIHQAVRVYRTLLENL